MKEFIEKLIERLEEEHERCINRYGVVGGNLPATEVKQCMEIVNQLAEEHNDDFCEWKFETTGIVWNCNGCETYNLPYAMNLRIIADDFECKCPYCGKKIKVVE